MTSQRTILGCALVAAAATATLLTSPAATAAPAQAPVSVPGASAAALPGDFDGDGHRDLVVAAPLAQVGQAARAGGIAVLYGSPNGPVTARKQTFHQNAPGIPGEAEQDDRFGESLTVGDFDRDGYSDLAVGAPGETGPVGGPEGVVTVIWGGTGGLADAAVAIAGDHPGAESGRTLVNGDFDGDGDVDLAFNEEDSTVRVLSGPLLRDGTPAATYRRWELDHRITDLASGDLNGDGRDDLVAARTPTRPEEGITKRHTVHLAGGPQGLSHDFVHVRTADDVQPQPFVEADEVAVGDVNGDGYDDIVAARPREGTGIPDPEPPAALGGGVTYVPGSATGPRGALAVPLHQDTPGVPGAAEAGDRFGSGIAVADLDGDGYADLAAGVPGEDFAGVAGADHGAVAILRGGAGGPTGAGAVTLHQNTPGVPGAAEAGDVFGQALQPVDTDSDGKPELYAGAPGENTNAGAVWAFDGTAAGPVAPGSVSFGPGAVDIAPGPGEFGAAFRD
ncbi:FG-GAP-like repeat-containing protein [Streptomyces amakusaensis]|uniref:FG-GAP-like repeat-containing protein n=1 Tax=Streptomyces amakusaensis TaxID=67271 RepID=A0ABW0AEQ2_9ACTN